MPWSQPLQWLSDHGALVAIFRVERIDVLEATTGRDDSFIQYVQDRPGHDRVYLIDHSKATRELGWSPQVSFAQGLADTVTWFRENRSWWEAVKSGEYLAYYEKQYGKA